VRKDTTEVEQVQILAIVAIEAGPGSLVNLLHGNRGDLILAADVLVQKKSVSRVSHKAVAGTPANADEPRQRLDRPPRRHVARDCFTFDRMMSGIDLDADNSRSFDVHGSENLVVEPIDVDAEEIEARSVTE